jgi:uncharacterized protein YchJ
VIVSAVSDIGKLTDWDHGQARADRSCRLELKSPRRGSQPGSHLPERFCLFLLAPADSTASTTTTTVSTTTNTVEAAAAIAAAEAKKVTIIGTTAEVITTTAEVEEEGHFSDVGRGAAKAAISILAALGICWHILEATAVY